MVVPVAFLLLLAAAGVEGTFTGKGGLPARDTTTTFKGTGDKATVTWADSDGRKGSAPAAWNGNEVSFTRDGFGCTLVLAPDGASFSGMCHERLGAEARAPMSYAWEGRRRAPRRKR